MAARQVQARIDSHAKVLYARLADPRSATFANALRISAHQLLTALYHVALDCICGACACMFRHLRQRTGH